MTEKIIALTGAATQGMAGGRRRARTRKNQKQYGGEMAGSLGQVVNSRPTNGSGQGANPSAPGMAASALAQLGPDSAAIQTGGDNSGALMQLSQVPANISGPINSQNLQTAFRSHVGQILSADFGPDKAQQGGRKQKGGDLTSGVIQLRSSEAPTLPGSPPAVGVVSGISPEQPAPVGGGRIVLAPPKRKTRIALKAKKVNGPAHSGGAPTRKARKIHLRVKGVTSRLAKAKKAKKMAMAAPISEVKTRLESAGVIKKTSKAPEPMLRTMYADLLITKKGL
jgi:hypothetical protein